MVTEKKGLFTVDKSTVLTQVITVIVVNTVIALVSCGFLIGRSEVYERFVTKSAFEQERSETRDGFKRLEDKADTRFDRVEALLQRLLLKSA